MGRRLHFVHMAKKYRLNKEACLAVSRQLPSLWLSFLWGTVFCIRTIKGYIHMSSIGICRFQYNFEPHILYFDEVIKTF